MATNKARLDALTRRVEELEQRRRDAEIFPDEIWIVGARRNADGELVEASRYLHWKRDPNSRGTKDD